MTIEEAIKHCEEVADSKCDKCGAEHKQLAKWLIELKEHREHIRGRYTSNDKRQYKSPCALSTR